MSVNRQLKLLPAFIFLIASAYGQDVHYDYERGANFAAYRTYQWADSANCASTTATQSGSQKIDLPPAPPNFDPPPGLPKLVLPDGLPRIDVQNGPPKVENLNGAPCGGVQGAGSDDQLLDQEIKRAIEAQLAEKGLTKVEKNADIQVAYHAAVHHEIGLNLQGMSFGGIGGGLGWRDGSVSGQTSSIPMGSLVVDLYDPARKQLIWRGDASKTIDVKKDPNKNYANLQKAMTKLFKNYPPKVGK